MAPFANLLPRYEMYEITIWEDDLPEEVMERLAGVLCELGILVCHVSDGFDEDLLTRKYDFKLADPLPEPDII